MATQTDIINLAIYKLAQSIAIPAITDESKAADIFNRLWEPMRDLVLAARVWPWALKAQALAVDTEPAQPGWRLRYSYPNDCITAKALTDANGLRAVRMLSNYCDDNYLRGVWGRLAFDWETSYGEQGTTINADQDGAYLVYVVRVEDTGRYPPNFVNALACRLAAEAAPPMIGEVGLNNKQSLLQEYNVALTDAGAHSYNEGSLVNDYVTPALASREGG
ncbi:MAG TPA: hypothetical protein VN017_05295 [Pseudoxanthomonas sp.]|nr:hypothetical protein [Pseudoxanthomonas sp.]